MPDNSSAETSLKLNSLVFGKGGNSILAFHGFGQDADHYRIFGEYFGVDYIIHSFDLPFHGKTALYTFPGIISTSKLREFFTEYLNNNKINKFSIIGYSIGAKFALNLVTLFPDRINRIILIAPDGLKINFWYQLATGNFLARGVFKFFMDHPALFFKFADLLTRTGLIHKSVSRFVHTQMGTPEQRKKVYQTWTKFRKLNLDLGSLGKSAKKYNIPIQIVLGEKDRIIRYRDIKPLLPRLPDTKIITLPVGHHRLIEDTAEYFRDSGF